MSKSSSQFVDSRIFSDPEIFEDELEYIFKQVWVPVCHESEVAQPYDFRTTSIARENILVVRAHDNKVNAFLNVCPHRGMLIERRPQGSFLEGQPSGNPKRITCMFHAWQFDMRGNCVYVAREKEGYQDRFSKNDAGLRRLRCEVKYGGFVWVNLNDQPQISLEEWVGDALEDMSVSIEHSPLEVFHYHKAVLGRNYKENHDDLIKFRQNITNKLKINDGLSEGSSNSRLRHLGFGHVISGVLRRQHQGEEVSRLYGELLDWAHTTQLPLRSDKLDEQLQRISAMMKSEIKEIIKANAPDQEKVRESETTHNLSFPNMKRGEWLIVDLFPGFHFTIHGAALSVMTVTPLAPDEVMLEVRGLGLKGDTEGIRSKRISDHNEVWSPLNIGLPAWQRDSDLEEQGNDEQYFRQYYNEWGRIMDRLPSNVDEKFLAPPTDVATTPPSKKRIFERPGLHVVVIGASHAGINVADKMRKNGFDGNITILDRQSGGPMERPPLSKAFLLESDQKSNSNYLLKQKKWYRTNDIRLRTKTSVEKINLETKKLILNDGEQIQFDKLVIASGAVPRTLPIAEGIGNVFVLRQPSDAISIRKQASAAKKIIIIGGGYIGLEVAASLRKKGLDIDVVEVADRILARVASAPAANFLADLHTSHGVSLLTGKGVDEIIEQNGVFAGVKLSDGTALSGDMLLIGIGVLPDSKLAYEAGLDTLMDDGGAILVDENMYTSHPDVLAVGDVALLRGQKATVESVHNAQETSAVAAATLTKATPPMIQAPWFWSDQYDTKLQSVGIVPVGDERVYQISRPGKREGGISFWSYRENDLVAVEVFSDPATYMEAKQCLDTGRSPDPNLIGDSSFSPISH